MGAVPNFTRCLCERLESGICEEEWRQAGRESADSVRHERTIVCESNREHARYDEHDQREAEQRAHPHLNASEPADAGDVNRIEEDETGDRDRQRRAATANQLSEVLRKRDGEIRERADVRNDLQPDADEGESIAAERARKMRVLAAGLAAERRR